MKQWIFRLRFLLQSLAAALVPIPGAVGIAAGLRRRFISVRMEGVSMLPTLPNGEVLKADSTAYSREAPRRGDIVIIPPPVPRARPPFLVKRVIGLPGEEVRIEHGHAYINDRRLTEPYVQNQAQYGYPPQRIPAGTYFLLGDNRNNSEDSHLFGPVRYNEIAGKVI
jgi:signal peptidase I